MLESEGIRHVEIRHKEKSSRDETDVVKESYNHRPPPHTQLLHGDSDQVSLDSLLKAVLDIDDRLNEQEEKLKAHDCSAISEESSRKKRDRRCPKTAVLKYAKEEVESSSSESELGQSQSSELSTKLSSTTKTKSQSRNLSAKPKSVAGSDARINLSFSNDTVRKIEQENQRLLKKIIDAKSSKTLGQNTRVRPQSASSINRLRQQREIERQNMHMLGRLQSVKPTKSLARNSLLTDHNRNEERVTRISKTRSRPSSAVSTRSMSSRADTIDNDSVLSAASSMRSMRSTSSKVSRATSAKSSRSGSSKVVVHRVWEPGW